VITVPTAGIRERTNFAIPKWLTTLLLVAPLFALFSLGGSATGECGEATELTADIVTGEIVNCDGSEFTGAGTGGGGTDFVALGEQIYMGGAVAGVNCSGCHGAGGQGSASFPSLAGVLTTFGACTDHVEWVSLGSAGFREAGRETYGDTQKPVTQGMPGFAGTLTAEQIAAVASFERVRFGGGDAEQVVVDCGLATPPGEEGDAGGGGETPSTTTPGA
jgi:mono/diheme cytochrome c family protein